MKQQTLCEAPANQPLELSLFFSFLKKNNNKKEKKRLEIFVKDSSDLQMSFGNLSEADASSPLSCVVDSRVGKKNKLVNNIERFVSVTMATSVHIRTARCWLLPRCGARSLALTECSLGNSTKEAEGTQGRRTKGNDWKF